MQFGFSLLFSVLSVGLFAALVVALYRIYVLGRRSKAERGHYNSILNAQRTRLNAYFQSSIDGVVLIDSSLRIVEFNDSAAGIFDLPESLARHQNFEELLLASSERQRDILGIAHFLKFKPSNQFSRRIETVGIKNGGKSIPLELSAVSIALPDGLLFAIFVRDMSRQNQALLDLRQAEQRWRFALEAAGEGVWDWNLVSGEALYSIKWLSMLGYTDAQSQMSFAQWRDLISPDDKEAVLQALLDHLDGRKNQFQAQFQIKCNNGDWKWVEARGQVVEYDSKTGAALRFVGTNSDISAKKNIQIEQELILQKSKELSEQLQSVRLSELNIGRAVQKTLLSQDVSRTSEQIWMSVYSRPSAVVDGDFYEVIRHNQHITDVIIGDVMGKGVNAALMGAATKMQLHRAMSQLITTAAHPLALPEPVEIVRTLTSVVGAQFTDLEAFVTLCYVRVDTQRQVITWVGCGHEETLLMRDQKVIGQLTNQQAPIGVLDIEALEQTSLDILPGDCIALYSDGLADLERIVDGRTSEQNSLHRLFERTSSKDCTPGALISRVRIELIESAYDPTDDMTVVILKFIPTTERRARTEVPCALSQIANIRQFVLGLVPKDRFTTVDAELFSLAAVEVFTNIVRHSTGFLDQATIEVFASLESSEVVVDFVYAADQFTVPNQIKEVSLDSFPDGGFGLHIIESVCSRHTVQHCGGITKVSISKAFSVPTALVALSI